jgi:hypothetical protein
MGLSPNFAQATDSTNFTLKTTEDLYGQHGNDPGRRGLGEAGFVRHRDDPCPLFFRQGMRLRWADGIRPPVAVCQTVVLSPALDGARIDTRQNTGGRLPGTVGTGLGDLVNQGRAIFQAGHASSSSWKIAASFFLSTSKAAVSASALSLR